jgi:outer membrane cobalamin receptor
MLGVLASSASLSGQSSAPAPSKAEETVKLEAFTVTGTNIRRLESENVLPVSVVFSEQIEIRNASTPIDLLTSLPQVVSIPLNEVQTNGVSARGDNASISLRGIASANTLVLLNGRRVAPHP